MLNIYGVAILVCRECVVVIRRIAVSDRNLADQLRRAVTSVPLNIAESDGQAGGNRRQRRLSALGSAREVKACIEVAEAMGYIDEAPREIMEKLEHVIGVLVKVARP